MKELHYQNVNVEHGHFHMQTTGRKNVQNAEKTFLFVSWLREQSKGSTVFTLETKHIHCDSCYTVQ